MFRPLGPQSLFYQPVYFLNLFFPEMESCTYTGTHTAIHYARNPTFESEITYYNLSSTLFVALHMAEFSTSLT